MNRDEVLTILTAHRHEILGYGVQSLLLFGSVARDEGGPESDVDLLVDFGRPPSFDSYMNLKLALEDLLGKRVDLVTIGGLRVGARPGVEKDAIRVA